MTDEEVFKILEEIALANNLTIEEVKDILEDDTFVMEMTNIMKLEQGTAGWQDAISFLLGSVTFSMQDFSAKVCWQNLTSAALPAYGSDIYSRCQRLVVLDIVNVPSGCS